MRDRRSPGSSRRCSERAGRAGVDPFAPKAETKQEKKYRVRFYADGTKEQLAKLVEFLNENNIKYGKIAKESK